MWTTLVPRSPVAGDARNEFEVKPGARVTHVRLTMYPDGGVARLRVYGEPVPDPRLLPATIDLAALENGAVVTGCSNMFYSSPANLLLPGQAPVMAAPVMAAPVMAAPVMAAPVMATRSCCPAPRCSRTPGTALPSQAAR
jgi:hypothetical protein